MGFRSYDVVSGHFLLVSVSMQACQLHTTVHRDVRALGRCEQNIPFPLAIHPTEEIREELLCMEEGEEL